MFGEILSGVSAVAGLLDKGGKVQQAPTSGYQTYPQWLKDIYEQTAKPAILKQFNQPYQVLPMARYEADPNDPFTSKALLELQAYSDATGGFFNPYGAGQNALGGSNTATQNAAQAQQMQAMQEEMAAQNWIARQMAQQLPNTRNQMQYQKIKNMSGLGSLLSGYRDTYGEEAGNLDRLMKYSQISPELQQSFRGIF